MQRTQLVCIFLANVCVCDVCVCLCILIRRSLAALKCAIHICAHHTLNVVGVYVVLFFWFCSIECVFVEFRISNFSHDHILTKECV